MGDYRWLSEVTGHMPWCEDHRGPEDGGRGWCSQTVWTVAAEVEIHNRSEDGGVLLDLHLRDGIDTSELTLGTARAIAAAITMAADIASNLTPDPSDDSE
jgi:hypothetical protein